MYISYLRFVPKPDEADAFLRQFKATGMLERPREIPGFLGGELAKGMDDESFMVIARWQDEQSYRDWQSVSIRGLSQPEIDDFLDTLVDPGPGSLFEVVHSSEGTGADG